MMTQIADPRWDEYARLQRILAQRHIADDTTSGLEAGLNLLVSTASPLPGESSVIIAQRAHDSAMRRQRRRRGILAREEGRLFDLSRADADLPAEAAVHARIEFTRIFQIVTPAERDILVGVAVGDDLAENLGLAPATFRKRLQRLRTRLAA